MDTQPGAGRACLGVSQAGSGEDLGARGRGESHVQGPERSGCVLLGTCRHGVPLCAEVEQSGELVTGEATLLCRVWSLEPRECSVQT